MLACLLSFYCLLNISVDSESDMFYTLIHLDFSVCALCHIMEFKWFKKSFTHNNTVNGANARFASTASIPSASLDVRVDTHLWLVTKCNNCFHPLYTSVLKNSGQESCLYYFLAVVSCCLKCTSFKWHYHILELYQNVIINTQSGRHTIMVSESAHIHTIIYSYNTAAGAAAAVWRKTLISTVLVEIDFFIMWFSLKDFTESSTVTCEW